MYSALEAKIGPGGKPSWTETKGWEAQAVRRSFRFKEEEEKEEEALADCYTKDGEDSKNDVGKDEAAIFHLRWMPKACGEPWDGRVIPSQMRQSIRVDTCVQVEKHEVVANYRSN